MYRGRFRKLRSTTGLGGGEGKQVISCYGWEGEFVMTCRERALIASSSGRSVKTSIVKFSMDNKEFHHQQLGDNLPNANFEGNFKKVLKDEEVLPPALSEWSQNKTITFQE